MDNKKVIFVPSCEGLAHAGRMLVVAKVLRDKFKGVIEFAGDGKYGNLFPEAGFPFHEIGDSKSVRILSLDHKRFLFDRKWTVSQCISLAKEVLSSYQNLIKMELDLFRNLKPDLIIWDGRLSVPISAEVSGIPSISFVHSWLTPFSKISYGFPKTHPLLIKFPWLNFLGKLPVRLQNPLAQYFWRVQRYFFLKLYNKLRGTFDLAPLKSYSELFKKLPLVLLPDLAAMSPSLDHPKNFHYVGPLGWEPDVALPESLKNRHDLIYICMGSTGSPEIFEPLMEAFSGMPELEFIFATGDVVDPRQLKPLSSNLSVYKYLPGLELAKRSRLFICHGGLGTIYQALSQGVPIIGIPFILSQEIAGIDQVVALGAGMKLILSELNPEKIKQAVKEVLAGEHYSRQAKKISTQFSLDEGPMRSAEIILDQLSRL